MSNNLFHILQLSLTWVSHILTNNTHYMSNIFLVHTMAYITLLTAIEYGIRDINSSSSSIYGVIFVDNKISGKKY